MITSHRYQEPNNVCQECGSSELDHFWKCKKCEMVGNGNVEHNCSDDD